MTQPANYPVDPEAIARDLLQQLSEILGRGRGNQVPVEQAASLYAQIAQAHATLAVVGVLRRIALAIEGDR